MELDSTRFHTNPARSNTKMAPITRLSSIPSNLLRDAHSVDIEHAPN